MSDAGDQLGAHAASARSRCATSLACGAAAGALSRAPQG